MITPSKTLSDLLELANNYPSPHNGQPIRVKQIDESSLELYFDKDRGLQATDISYIFSFVSMGVFAEHLQRSAIALGHAIQITPHLPDEAELRGEGLVLIAVCKIQWSMHEPNLEAIATIRTRQTSRKKYYAGVSDELVMHITKVAKDANMKLGQLSPSQATQAIWLNQRAVFDDMFDEPVHQELKKWLRYSQQEKLTKRDGLAYDCMELNGRLLRFIVNHPGILRAPLFANGIRQYYLRTMKDESDVLYMMAPFATGTDAYAVGKVIMTMWLELTKQGYYLHPFGTIMSNHQAHADFLHLVNETGESRSTSYLVFIFRAGKSKVPVRSVRLPIESHLTQE